VIDLPITLQNEPALLLPEGALFLARTQTLIVADVHLGKDTSFRAAGIPIPGDTTLESLERLSLALTRTAAQRIIFLGDLVHARSSLDQQTIANVAAWRAGQAAIEMILVPGNHDARSGRLPDDWQLTITAEEMIESPFVFRHHPEASPHGYTLAGHIHPAVRLIGRGRQRERLACFFFRPDYGVLPAFGTFTGAYTVTPQAGDRVFVVAQDQVVDVTA
jgi:uncharacterized protein